MWRDNVEIVRAANPIAVVAARYTELRQAGHDLVGRCPLHDDHTPSFTVTPLNGKWFCFGCQTGGDVFRLVELVEQVPFREALDRLSDGQPTARRAVPVCFTPPPKPVRVLTDEEIALLTQVVGIYHAALLDERAPREYLAQRRIAPPLWARRRLGYARPGELLNSFPAMADRARLTALGLLNETGREVFRQRLMLPELREDRAVYVVGRSMGPAQRAKYLGLRDVPKPLYGAARIITDEPLILCEGPLDQLTLDGWGYPAVALLGTYLKPNQVAELAIAERVVIATDSDTQGQEAAMRIAAQLGPRARILPKLPGNAKDVNELAQQPNGRTRFAELLAV